jgi:plasmid stabilization system protein ParE
MVMMPYQIELSIFAEYDLEDIALYTFKNYGLK